jgi:DNA invertase Pin-like site-specific DNA recombinase
MPQAVAIYARISEDREDDRLGVQRQLDDCQADAERRGWPVADTYVDDDVSAYSGKPRPEYNRMLEDIRQGRVDGVVVWHLDRLHRHPKELEEFFDVCSAADVHHLATVQGDVDLSTHDGQFHARILGAVAKKESDDKSRRAKRKHLEIAQAGRWAGSPRAFGYDDQGQIVPTEAEVIREMARRVLAGEALRTLTRDLEARGVPTVRGGRWSMQVLRGILMRPAVAGLRSLRGEVVGRGVWEPILSVEEHQRICAVLTDPARRLSRPARRYLLTGMLYCGRCGVKLITRPHRHQRSYLCGSGPGLVGCGGISILADPLEEFVTEAVLYRLDTPDLAEAIAHASASHHPDGDVEVAIAADERQLEELAKAYAARLISMPEWLIARKVIEDRLTHQRSNLLRRDRHRSLRGLVGHGDELRQRWSALNLDQQRAVVSAVLDRLTVNHAARAPGRGRFDTDRLEPVWRV